MKQYFALGSYTEDILFGTGEIFHGKGRGISICEFDEGVITMIGEIQVRNPSFLCLGKKNKKIYAVNEMKEYNGSFGGGVTQISYDEDYHMVIEREFQAKGTDPCHIIMSPDETFLSVANFASGSVTVFPMDEGGNICGEGQLYQHQGSSIDPVRQKGPHAHSSIFAPDQNRMYVPDLGTDRLMAYEYKDAALRLDEQACISVLAGSGPRFGEFDRTGYNFYLINEISSQIIHFAYAGGRMRYRETVNTLPDGFDGNNICSDLHLTPDGRRLFASNRGHDSITGYLIKQDGSLEFVSRTGCGGKTPRNFAVDPTGRFLLCGNQDSDDIAVFEIKDDGTLWQSGEMGTGSPVCIRFF